MSIDNLVSTLNQINSLPGNSLLERMLSYCEENDIDPKELGDMFEESDQFKRVLWIDAVENNQIQDAPLKAKLNETQDLDTW
jgi:hypothetical protein